MGLSTATDRNLWKDKALTELNLAVLHSFDAAGVAITDHHTESARFLQHIQREERHGRPCPADWSWIVPPTASSATPVFHRTYADFDQTPNFYRHPAPATQAPLTPAALTQVPLPLPPMEQGLAEPAPIGPAPMRPAPMRPALLEPALMEPAPSSRRELPQPVDEMAALCPHQAGEHVPHLRMLEEQGGEEKQLT
jgi:hypothetical protein